MKSTTMNKPQSDAKTPSEQALSRIRKYAKSGTSGHPNPDVTEAVVLGLAAHQARPS